MPRAEGSYKVLQKYGENANKTEVTRDYGVQQLLISLIFIHTVQKKKKTQGQVLYSQGSLTLESLKPSLKLCAC